jgi:colicin import membrane protein
MSMTETKQEMLALVTIPESRALAYFTEENALDPILAKIKTEIDAFKGDVSTSKGREEIRAMAFKVTRSKTYLEGVGKALSAEQKKIPGKIDAARRLVADTLDGWRDELRKPLTDWEEAEAARVKKHTDYIDEIAEVGAHASAAQSSVVLRNNLQVIEAIAVGPDCEEYEANYARAKDAALSALRTALDGAEKREADEAELIRLREQAAKQAQIDREAKIAKDAADAAEAAANAKAERERRAAADAAKAEQDRIANAAKAERDAAEKRIAAAQAETEAANKRAAETEARLKREAEQAAERKRQEEAAERAAAEKKAANRRHQQSVNRAAVAAFVDGGIDETVAMAVITLIAAQKIPRIAISY